MTKLPECYEFYLHIANWHMAFFRPNCIFRNRQHPCRVQSVSGLRK